MKTIGAKHTIMVGLLFEMLQLMWSVDSRISIICSTTHYIEPLNIPLSPLPDKIIATIIILIQIKALTSLNY